MRRPAFEFVIYLSAPQAIEIWFGRFGFGWERKYGGFWVMQGREWMS